MIGLKKRISRLSGLFRNRRWRAIEGYGIIVVVGLLLAPPVLMAFLYGIHDKRSFIIEARILGAEVQFGEQSSGRGAEAWRLESVTMCTRNTRGRDRSTLTRSNQDKPGLSDEGKLCPGDIYEAKEHDVIEVIWPPGSLLKLSYDPSGYLEIAVIGLKEPVVGSNDVTIEPGAFLLMPVKAWRRGGVLPFQADLTLGIDIGAGEPRILVEGRYEAREELLLPGWFGAPRPITVAESDLIRGDRVRVVETESPDTTLRSYGFFSPPADDEKGGFEVVAYSPLADSELEISRFGSEPIHIRPSWHDAALRDPRLLAFVALAGVFVALLEVMNLAQNLRSSPPSGDSHRRRRHNSKR